MNTDAELRELCAAVLEDRETRKFAALERTSDYEPKDLDEACQLAYIGAGYMAAMARTLAWWRRK